MDVSLSPITERGPDLWGAAFDFSAEPTMLLDPHGDRIVEANPAVCALLG